MEKYIPLVRLSVIKEKEIPYAAGTINNPEKVAEFARNILNGADREHLLVLSIDSKCRPLAIEIVSIGTVNATMAEPRETFKHAVLAGAAGIILAHNHPSGDCTPSEEVRRGKLSGPGLPASGGLEIIGVRVRGGPEAA